MAINPLIALQGEVPNLGVGLNQIANRDIARTRSGIAQDLNTRQQTAADTLEAGRQFDLGNARDDRRISELGGAAAELLTFLDVGDDAGAMRLLENRKKDLGARIAAGEEIDTSDTDFAANQLRSGDRQGLITTANAAINLANSRSSGKGRTQSPLQSSGTIQGVDADGNPFSVSTTFDPNTGDRVKSVTALSSDGPQQPVGDLEFVGSTGETPTQRQTREVNTTTLQQRAKLKEGRTSDIVKEFSERNRKGARDQRRISEALQLSSQAGEGLSTAAAVKLSRIFPSIDVADEAALDAALTQLALDQLQNFKGQTTDFEFGVTQGIAGQGLDPKTSRKARLKSLERAAWFNNREADQFNRHINNGGDADNFRFNFGEEVTTERGVYTLQDLQDTAVANNIGIKDVINKLNGR